ncbi:hypothetical protein CBR_g20309 [Chara braunii]|uniref:Uncharacterized protein n=1 Tax=Chara braunii TaxID=69332 RepID=A0A388L0F7_CHABU|nr:hypothetical protein CBR_g20309 [Chara braunii]|eukprot:GBG75683.1 hypothetical protein CBR_g20309 [Chara braunii]
MSAVIVFSYNTPLLLLQNRKRIWICSCTGTFQMMVPFDEAVPTLWRDLWVWCRRSKKIAAQGTGGLSVVIISVV